MNVWQIALHCAAQCPTSNTPHKGRKNFDYYEWKQELIDLVGPDEARHWLEKAFALNDVKRHRAAKRQSASLQS